MPRNEPSFEQLVVRGLAAAATTFLAPAARSGKKMKGGGRRRPPGRSSRAAAITGTTSSLAASLLLRWSKARRPPLHRLLRGAAAGIAAAGAVHALRALLRDDSEKKAPAGGDFADELMAGAGRGLLYAALLAPHLPGPPLIRGALAGTADYLTAPIGGLFSRLQPLSPIRRVPVVSILLETGDAEDDPYLTFLLHGALLGLLYGVPRKDD